MAYINERTLSYVDLPYAPTSISRPSPSKPMLFDVPSSHPVYIPNLFAPTYPADPNQQVFCNSQLQAWPLMSAGPQLPYLIPSVPFAYFPMFPSGYLPSSTAFSPYNKESNVNWTSLDANSPPSAVLSPQMAQATLIPPALTIPIHMGHPLPIYSDAPNHVTQSSPPTKTTLLPSISPGLANLLNTPSASDLFRSGADGSDVFTVDGNSSLTSSGEFLPSSQESDSAYGSEEDGRISEEDRRSNSSDSDNKQPCSHRINISVDTDSSCPVVSVRTSMNTWKRKALGVVETKHTMRASIRTHSHRRKTKLPNSQDSDTKGWKWHEYNAQEPKKRRVSPCYH